MDDSTNDLLTPFEKLDDAVRTYLAEIGDTDHLSAWALCIETQGLTPDERLLPITYSSSFVMGPSTSPSTAVGLLSAATVYVREHAMPQDYDPDNEG